MEIGLAVGGVVLSSGLQVLFDRLAPQGELLKMFQKPKHDVRLLKKLRITLLDLQVVLSDAENKQASNPYVSQWLSELQYVVDGAENLIEEVNYEALRLKVEGQHQNIAEGKSSEVSWALFKRHSLENTDLGDHPDLEQVGKQIAHKCKGLPLALKALAGILRSKSEVEEWRDILRSEIWELPSRSEGILPPLMLSYTDLPAHLKRCFSFCAIYPKDYLFCKEQVIHLWIANGLIQRLPSGSQYFLELISRSLFGRVSKYSQGNTEKFTMHDLVNDLTQIASSNLCIRLEEIQGSHNLEQSRHMSYSMGYGDFEKLKSLYKSEQLRTLLPICFDPFRCGTLRKRVLHNYFCTTARCSNHS